MKQKLEGWVGNEEDIWQNGQAHGRWQSSGSTVLKSTGARARPYALEC